MAVSKQKPEDLDALFDRAVPGEGWVAFAQRAGVSVRTIQRLRAGLVDRPARTQVGRIAEALGVPVAELRAAIDVTRAKQKK